MVLILNPKQLCVYIALILLTVTGRLNAQTAVTGANASGIKPFPGKIAFDSLISLYGRKHSAPVLFIHFDKNVYSNNENVWFTGYLLNMVPGAPYTTLSLALVKDDDRAVLMDDRFVISNGFCFGNAVIPDSVRAGAYTFVAYGNRLENNLPDVIFTQQVTIKTEYQPAFTASLNPLDTAASATNQKVMLLVNFINEKSPPSSVPVTYYVGNAGKPVTGGAVKTASGQYIFNIPSKLLSGGNNKLNVQVKYKAEVQDLSLLLPVPAQPAQIHFFPEGGNIVSGTVNTIGWEAKNTEGAPLYIMAVLYEDNQVLDTLQTSGNGMGRFLLIPDKDKKYYLKTIAQYPQIYDLPAITTAPAIKVKKAIVNDTLLVDVHNNMPSRKLFLIGHNYKQTFFETAIENRIGQRVKIILNDVPRGVLQLTLVDSIGRPYAERIIFAHYSNASKLDIATDSRTYNNRKKVKLNIELNGKATYAAVSVAVVQENRLEIKNKSNIESYMYLKSDLNDIPVRESYFSNEDLDKRDLENILLIRGWRRYKWTDVLKAEQADGTQNKKQLLLTGRVTKNAGKFKRPVSLVTFGPTGVYQTDINGNFALADSNIVTEPEKKMAIIVANDNPSDFNINLINPYDSLNKHLANLIKPVVYHSQSQESSAGMQLAGNDRAIRIKEVVIKEKKVDDEFHAGVYVGGAGANECGDYVCEYNILNCPNHRNAANNTTPIEGMTYRNIVYKGCKINQAKRKSALTFKGIYAAQEFYPSDYSQINPSQPEYISTLYWKDQLMLKKGEAQEVSFYTSDISGAYKVVVQGITNDDVVYGETSFGVIK